MDFKREKEKRWEGWIVVRRKVIVKEKGSIGFVDDYRLKARVILYNLGCLRYYWFIFFVLV